MMVEKIVGKKVSCIDLKNFLNSLNFQSVALIDNTLNRDSLYSNVPISLDFSEKRIDRNEA
jgi:hypothetical protein